MTLGTKLATYRRLAGLTQQQLGEHLSLSAQAISKWEKDLAQPDLSTLRRLADLYKVTVDELIDLNAPFTDPNPPEAEPQKEDPKPDREEKTIGFCTRCGIVVTEETIGAADPVILCQKCLQAKKEKERREAEAKKKELAQIYAKAEAAKNQNRFKLRRRCLIASIVALIAVVALLSGSIIAMVNSFSLALLITTVTGIYVIYTFVFCLFFDSAVQEVVCDWFSKSLSLPGLIFTFDVDGCLWLIGMKILYFFLGLLFGIVTGIIGITLGLIIAPFVFPFLLHKIRKILKTGEQLEEVL